MFEVTGRHQQRCANGPGQRLVRRILAGALRQSVTELMRDADALARCREFVVIQENASHQSVRSRGDSFNSKVRRQSIDIDGRRAQAGFVEQRAGESFSKEAAIVHVVDRSIMGVTLAVLPARDLVFHSDQTSVPTNNMGDNSPARLVFYD